MKTSNKTKRKIWPEVLLIISALILGTLVVLLVYRAKTRPSTEDETRTITGSFPLPSELVEADKPVYFPVMQIPDMVFEKMQGVSFREDCPVTRDELRYIKLLHWGTDGKPHQGEIIVNEQIADDVQDIFFKLYKASYPIESVQLVDVYGGNDEISMTKNNTSGFNARKMTDGESWSKHAHGMAIDLNPKYNPYVNGELILPVDSVEYADRTKSFRMKIDGTDYAYKLFTSYGFTWGGNWTNLQDYQHFEK